MIHDVARPLVSKNLVKRIAEKAYRSSAVIPAIPIVDTIKKVSDGCVIETISRNNMMMIQTPQCFDFGLLKKGYARCYDEEITDEAMMVEKMGEVVDVVTGDFCNRKVTYFEDLALIERLMDLNA